MTYRPHPRLENGLCAICGFGSLSGCAGPRPMLIGMNNDPDCRLWTVLNEATGAARSQYLRRFARTNILPGKEWNRREAVEAARDLRRRFLAPVVVIVGAGARDVFNLHGNWGELSEPMQWGMGLTRWTWIPHPSGRNPFYNSADNRARVGAVLRSLYNGEHHADN